MYETRRRGQDDNYDDDISSDGMRVKTTPTAPAPPSSETATSCLQTELVDMVCIKSNLDHVHFTSSHSFLLSSAE